MILLAYKPEKCSKTIRAQIELVKVTFPDIIEVDLAAEELDFCGETVINIGNHQYAGSVVLNKAAAALRSCKKLISLMDDYMSPPASQVYNSVRGKDNIIVTSVKDLLRVKTGRMFNWAKQSVYTNLNAMSWAPLPIIKPTITGLIYYGMFRENRREYFETYLGLGALDLYDVSVSGSHRAMKKFFDVNFALDDYPRSKNIVSFLQQFEFSVYLEDVFSHLTYCSPANRFYECASAGIPLFFDKSCLKTFDIAGINIGDYAVSSPEQIISKLHDNTNIAKEQRKLWAKDYKKEATEEFKAALRGIV